MYNILSTLVNVVEGSSKRQELLRNAHLEKDINDLMSSELATGRGLNQESSLQRASDTRWSSHFASLLKFLLMFDSVIDVLEIIQIDGDKNQRGQAYRLISALQSFEFIFITHLMKRVMSITNSLCESLQRKDPDIVNAMSLVEISKKQLQAVRDSGWDSLLKKVFLFCEKHDIIVPKIDDKFIPDRRSQRKAQEITNLHHYRFDLFNEVVDLQLTELGHRFSETATEFLRCMACLNPSCSFSSFDKKRLIELAEFYPGEFSELAIGLLDAELDTYIMDMKSANDFLNFSSKSDLAHKMVEKKRDGVYPMVYMLLKLSLTLPVSSTSVERAFSAMNIVKSQLRNRMGDSWLNDCLVAFIEKSISRRVDEEKAIKHYQNMKTRRETL